MRQKSKKKKENIWIFESDMDGVVLAVSHCKFISGNPDIPGSRYKGRVQHLRNKPHTEMDSMITRSTSFNSQYVRCMATNFEDFIGENIHLFL